jgi:hypothetical protein
LNCPRIELHPHLLPIKRERSPSDSLLVVVVFLIRDVGSSRQDVNEGWMLVDDIGLEVFLDQAAAGAQAALD